MTAVIESSHPSAVIIGKRIQIYECVDSTNNCAAGLAHDSRNEGTVIVAERQTAGRGQYGRVWECPPASGILMSVLLFPPAKYRRPVLMTALAAVALSETIVEVAQHNPRIKWPNDLLLHERKVSGILIEQGQAVVIGIGLNVNQSAEDFRQLGLPDATSLAIQAGKPFDAHSVLFALIRRLDNHYQSLLAGDTNRLETAWQSYLGLLKHRVRLERTDGTAITGRLSQLAFDGLQLLQPDGKTITIVPELVRHVSLHETTLETRRPENAG